MTYLGSICQGSSLSRCYCQSPSALLNGPAELWLLLCLSLFSHLRRQFLIICCLHLYRTHLVADLWLTDLWLISYRTFLQAFLRLSASASQHHFIAQSPVTTCLKLVSFLVESISLWTHLWTNLSITSEDLLSQSLQLLLFNPVFCFCSAASLPG